MNKIKAVNRFGIKFILALLVSLVFIKGCGKKYSSTSDSKSDNKTSSKDDNTALDKPFHVVFDISGISKGTVDAYYSGKKGRSSSSIEIGGQKMNATAYFDGDSKMMYMVNEIGGVKTGMKMDTRKMEDQK